MLYFASLNKIFLGFFLAVVFCIFSCKEESVSIKEVDIFDDEYIEYAIEQFKEPDISEISYKKAYCFNKAAEALVVMGEEWAEKLSQMEDEEILKITAVYEKAQDNLMRKFGLRGKEEFKWLQTKALADPANKDIFARAGVWSSN